MKFYKLCDKWKKEIKTQVREQGEHKKFHQSPEMIKVVQEVNEKLGLENDLLTVGEFDLIYLLQLILYFIQFLTFQWYFYYLFFLLGVLCRVDYDVWPKKLLTN